MNFLGIGNEERSAAIGRSESKDQKPASVTESQPQPRASSRKDTSVPIHVPVEISVRKPSGEALVYAATATLATRRGARFECTKHLAQQPFRAHSDIWITVLSTQQGTPGKVTGSESRPNKNGYFEFLAELKTPATLLDADSPNAEGKGPSAGNPAGEDQSSGTRTGDPWPDMQSKRAVELDGPSRKLFDSLLEDLGAMKTAAPAAEEDTAAQASVANLEVDLAILPGAGGKHRGKAQATTANGSDASGQLVPAVQMEDASERLIKEVKERIAETERMTLESLRSEIAEQAAAMQHQVLRECRSRIEQLLEAKLANAQNALSHQLDEMAAKTTERVQSIFAKSVEQLERRLAAALAETTSRLEEEMGQSAGAVRSELAQTVAGELKKLDEAQKSSMEQMQQQIETATEQNLAKLRGGLTRMLQGLAAASADDFNAIPAAPEGIPR